jgi:hypothetical protein
VQIFRVIVRGRFAAPTDEQRARLEAARPEHDLSAAGPLFTAAGSLAYDRRLDFFSVRVEVRVADDDATDPATARAVAFERATEVATGHLTARGLGWRDLRVTGQDMAAVWDR